MAAPFDSMDLDSMDLDSMDLDPMDLGLANSDLTDSDLTGLDLTDSDVADSDLEDSGLSGVRFMRMESPVSPDLSFHPFPRLPSELRLMIIEEFCRSREDTNLTPADETTLVTMTPRVTRRRTNRCRNPLAAYATVNRQWKSVVEKSTFRSLSFAIPDFGRDTPRWGRYSSSRKYAFDDPDALDELERLCVNERVKAVSEIQMSISLFSHDASEFADIWSPLPRPDGNTNQSVAQPKQLAKEALENVLRVLKRFQGYNLRLFYLHSGPQGIRMAHPGLHTQSSLRLGQLLFAMTCRLEELTLKHVVDVPWFLKESWAATGKTSQSPPAWPNMRELVLEDSAGLGTENYTCTAADLHDSVTQALRQLPKLAMLDVSAYIKPYYWRPTTVCFRIDPGDDHSAMREGHLFLTGTKPDPETMKLWEKIARQQWRCNNLDVHAC